VASLEFMHCSRLDLLDLGRTLRNCGNTQRILKLKLQLRINPIEYKNNFDGRLIDGLTTFSFMLASEYVQPVVFELASANFEEFELLVQGILKLIRELNSKHSCIVL
jgi:hypothetical protein